MLWFMFFIFNCIAGSDISDNRSESDNGSTISHNGPVESYSGRMTSRQTIHPIAVSYSSIAIQKPQPTGAQVQYVEYKSIPLTAENIRTITDSVKQSPRSSNEVGILQIQQPPQSPNSPASVINQSLVITKLPDLSVIHHTNADSQSVQGYLPVETTDITEFNAVQNTISHTLKPNLINAEAESTSILDLPTTVEHYAIDTPIATPESADSLGSGSKDAYQSGSSGKSSRLSKTLCKCARKLTTEE